MSRKYGKRPKNAPRNFVHVHGRNLNKGGRHESLYDKQKRGKRKHKTAWQDNQGGFFEPTKHLVASATQPPLNTFQIK